VTHPGQVDREEAGSRQEERPEHGRVHLVLVDDDVEDDPNLLTLDALIATYGMDGNELRDLMLLARSLYRGGEVTRRQALFLHDVSRSLHDLAIDARH
jgi:hypothetical protein